MIGHDARGAKAKGVRRSSSGFSRLVLVLIAGCLPVSPATAKYGGGSGTAADPYLINTADDFKAIGENSGDWDKQFKLMHDLDLSGYNEVNLTMIGRWVALGSLANQPFTGQFDGNGKAIANFTYRNLAADYVGLFQYVKGDIKNLRLLRPKATGNKSGTGALVGYLEGGVIDCSATQVEVSGSDNVGGLVGNVDGGVYRCSCDGVVSGVHYVGGLVGQVGKGTVKYSFSKAQVHGSYESIGGLLGALLGGGDAQFCYARGDVQGGVYVGGFAGQVSSGTVWHCYSVGKVSGDQFLGGLVGYQRPRPCWLAPCGTPSPVRRRRASAAAAGPRWR